MTDWIRIVPGCVMPPAYAAAFIAWMGEDGPMRDIACWTGAEWILGDGRVVEPDYWKPWPEDDWPPLPAEP
jgi:hypothetical protein